MGLFGKTHNDKVKEYNKAYADLKASGYTDMNAYQSMSALSPVISRDNSHFRGVEKEWNQVQDARKKSGDNSKEVSDLLKSLGASDTPAGKVARGEETEKQQAYLSGITSSILDSGKKKESAAPSEYARTLAASLGDKGDKGANSVYGSRLSEQVSGTILSQGRNVGILG